MRRFSRDFAPTYWAVLIIRGRQVVAYPLRLVKICKEVEKKEGDLMKRRRIAFVVSAVLVVTALSAAVAAAQNSSLDAQSGELAMPTDVAGSSPTNITSNFDTGNKQVITHMPGQTDTTSTNPTADPQSKERRERRERKDKDSATPTEAATPSSGNPANPGGSGGGSSGPSNSSGSTLKELPRTGGPAS